MVTATGSTNVNAYSPQYEGKRPLGSLDNFLKLFLTQLQYQDPLDPIKDHEFVAQLVQFSQLEELQTIKEQLTRVTSLLENNLSHHEFELLGQEVSVQGEEGFFSGMVEGITFTDGRPRLIVAGREVELGQVVQVGLAVPQERGE